MRNDIYYENHKGQMLSLSGEGIVCDIGGLFNWELDTQESNNRIVSFNRKTIIKKLYLAIYNSDKAMRLRDELYDIAAVDTQANKCGKIWCDGWYYECYIANSTIKYWWSDNGMATFMLGVISDNPVWQRDTSRFITERHDQTADGLDYPFNFPYDYGLAASEISINNANAYPFDMLIRIYGGTDRPSVTIGGNIYAVDITLQKDERLEIDTRDKTVMFVDIAGNRKSALDKIKGTYMKDSGSYIFQPLKSGQNKVEWSGVFDFDIVMHEVRDIVRFSDAANLYI